MTIKSVLEDILDANIKLYTTKEKIYLTIMGLYKQVKPVTKTVSKYFGAYGKKIDQTVTDSEQCLQDKYSKIEGAYGPGLTAILNLFPSKRAKYGSIPEIKSMLSKYK